MPYLTQNLSKNLTIEVFEVVFLPVAELLRVCRLSISSRNDGDRYLLHRCSSECDLRRKTGAQSASSRVCDPSQTLEYRALSAIERSQCSTSNQRIGMLTLTGPPQPGAV